VNVTTVDGTETSALTDFNYSLLGYWRFESVGDSTPDDSSTYGNDGTLKNGAKYNHSGARGIGVSFDGINDYVEVDDSGSLQDSYGEGISIEFWMNPFRIPTARMFMTARQETQSYTGFETSIRIRWRHQDLSSTSSDWNFNAGDVPEGEWSHMAFTYDGSRTRIYFNGVEKVSLARTGTIDFISGQEFRIGAYTQSPFFYFNGSMDEVKLWNRAISAEEVNASFNNGIYRLEQDYTGLAALTYNFTSYVVDDAGNINQTAERSVDINIPDNVSLNLNLLHVNVTYEYGTTATINASLNVSTRIVCIDIIAPGYGLNFSCSLSGNSSTEINVTWNLLRENEFNGSDTTLTFNTNSEFFIPLDNRTFLDNVSFNVSGIGNPENITIYSSSDRAEVVLPGKLNGSVLLQQKFILNDDLFEFRNLSFFSAGVKTIFFNFSTISIGANESLDFKINVSGFNVDEGNEIDRRVVFNSTDFAVNLINETERINSSSINGTWEDFGINRTAVSDDRWSETIVNNGAPCFSREYESDNRTFVGMVFGDGGATGCNIHYWETEFDLRNVSRIDLRYKSHVSCNKGSGGGGACFTTANVIVYDETSRQDFYTEFCSLSIDACTRDNDVNLTLIKRFGTDTWDVTEDGASEGSLTITLPESNRWYLGFYVEAGCTDPNCIHRSADVRLIDITVGSVMGNITDSGHYNSPVSVTSTPVDNTANDITAAILTSVDLTQNEFGTVNVSYELSNNNGVNWQTAPVGERVVFDNTGSDLIWRVNCTTTDSRDTCFVSEVRVQVIEGSISNVSFDVGADGTEDFEIGGFFNQSEETVEVTNGTNPVYNYITTNCKGLSCLVPISISSASPGILSIDTFNFSRPIGRLFMNITPLENITNMRFSVNFSMGSVVVDDINADYKGTKTFAVNAVFYDNLPNVGSNISLNVTIKYSPFNLTLPLGVDFYEVFFRRQNENNVTPLGQTNTTPVWNITNLAYDTDINISIRVNQTWDHYNITFSNNNTKSSDFLLTNTSQFLVNITLANWTGVWAWHDSNVTGIRFIIDYFEFSSICFTCFPTFDRFDANVILTDPRRIY